MVASSLAYLRIEMPQHHAQAVEPAQLVADARRHAACECTRGDLGTGCEQGLGGYECPSSDPRPMQDRGSRAHEGTVLHDASLEVSQVADGAAVADGGVQLGRAVDDRAVLDGGLLADDDATVVAAQDGGGPDSGFRADSHLANHDGVRVNEGLGRDVGDKVAKGVDGHGVPPEGAPQACDCVDSIVPRVM